jgi:hypothetical protein
MLCSQRASGPAAGRPGTAIWGCGRMSRWPYPQPPLILCRNSLAGRKPSHGCWGWFVVRYGLTASRHLASSAAKAEGMYDLRMRAGLHAIFREIRANAWEGGAERCSLSAPVPISAKELHCGTGNVEAQERRRMLGKSIDWLECVFASFLWRPARAIKLGSRQAGGAKRSCGFLG